MKKRELTTLAMIGISSLGLVSEGCQKNTTPPKALNANEQMSPDMQELYSSLTPVAQKKFNELDAQHKMMVMEMLMQNCSGKNQCAGMGGCATNEHVCAGKNSCKGKGGTPISNANKAIDVQYNNQMEQRQKTSDQLQNHNAPKEMK